MATRDRTALFLRYREDARALHRRSRSSFNDESFDRSGEHSKLYEDNRERETSQTTDPSGTVNIRRGGMEPDWVFAYNELTGDIAELKALLERLTEMYAKHLLPSFEEKNTFDLEHEIRLEALQLTKMLHNVEHKVRNISTQEVMSDEKGGKIERVIRVNLQKRFATPLQELSMSFRKKQKAYMDKLKEQRETEANSQNQALGTLIDIGNESATETYDTGLSEGQLLTVENASALVDERSRELNRVAENINDLATLVKDIASLVVDQGTVLDRVDYNLEEVKLKTLGAVRELNITNRYQRKRHALCCIIILSIACGMMFIVLVFKWTS